MRKIILTLVTMIMITNIYCNSNNEIITSDVEIFNNTELLEINITIDEENWELMNKDLTNNLPASKMGNGENGDSQEGFPPMGEGQNGRPPMGEGQNGRPPMGEGQDRMPPMGEGQDRMPPMGEGQDGLLPMGEGQDGMPAMNNEANQFDDFDPIWVESKITFNNETWEHVGIRFKGNSSLMSASQGNTKLSFKLDFDEFETEYPETENQRFYGFKQLNLNNNYSDSSLVREKVASDLFREFGLVSAQTTFCLVNVDYGKGLMPYGIYTIVEEMDDTVIKDQLGDDSGNLYKPDGDAATFAEGSFNTEEMYKKSNKDEADYTDVENLYNAINSSLRTSDSDLWKQELESVFNVDGFLKWLAVNSVIQNWDTYGSMSHNYYLYNNPETGLLNWIPWDNNESLQNGKRGNLTISLDETNSSWPLIRYILDEENYKNIYDGYIEEFTSEIFTVEKMTTIYNEYYTLLKRYSSESAIEELKSHVTDRNELVNNYLKK